MEDEQKKDKKPENEEKKIDYGYLFGVIVLGIFLVYWTFFKHKL